jgi:tetratricopeptide (TPR) repeat protein
MQRGQTLVVGAELTDMMTDSQLWGDRLTRSTTDIFAVQEEMATEIAKSLRVRLSPEEHQELVHRQTEDSEAYHAYLRGRHQWNKRTRDGFMRAIEHFEAAIDRDPRYAAAYTGLSDVYNVLGYYSFIAPRDAYPRARAASMRALELVPDLAEAHASLGYTRLFFDWDWENAASSFRRAIALDPTYSSAHQWYAWYLLVAGRLEQMIASMRTALDLDPLSLIINAHMGYALFVAGRHPEALKQLKATLALDPDFALSYWALGAVHFWQGNAEEAIAAFRAVVTLTHGELGLGYLGLTAGRFGQSEIARESLRLLEEAGATRFVSSLDRAICYAGLGEFGAAFEWLDRAFEERVSDLVRLDVLPWPPDMRNDARFVAAVAKLKLPR